MSENRLDRMVTELRDYAGELETELKRVRRALAALDETESAESQHSETSTTDLVTQVFRANPDQVLTAAETAALMEERGWVSDSRNRINVVRTALARLATNGELERVGEGRGKYRLAASPDDDVSEPDDPVDDDVPEEDPWYPAPDPPGEHVPSPARTRARTYDDEPPF